MYNLLKLAVATIAITFHVGAAAQDAAARTYEKALDLVHAFSGNGPELEQAMQIAQALAKSAPKSGYAQVLYGEALSTWRLDLLGRPVELREQILTLADEALQLNPKLAQAHVVKARTLSRAQMYDAAEASVAKALALDPNLSGAIFIRGEIFKRKFAYADAETWFRKFIASTPSETRKANGYSHLAQLFETAGRSDDRTRSEYLAKARESHELALKHDPHGAWRIMEYVKFLNGAGADYAAAEQHARVALTKMDSRAARFHLAAAQYQKLEAAAANQPPAALRSSAKAIADATGITVSEAIGFQYYASQVTDNLKKLQARLAGT